MRKNIKILAAAFIVCGIVVSSASAQPRVIRGSEPTFPPATGTSTLMVNVAPGAMPDSLEMLADRSELIVDGYVQSNLIPWINGHSLQTDAIFLVSRVLKGPPLTEQIVVSQTGGVLGQFRQAPKQYSLMQTGEHHILFLAQDARLNGPDRNGLPRYWVQGAGISGLLRVDVDRIHVSQGAPAVFRGRYEGMNFAQAIAIITAHVQPGRPR